MKKEPIFEVLLDPDNGPFSTRAIIYVQYQGQRMTLIDAMHIIEKTFRAEGTEPEKYRWLRAAELYKTIMKSEKSIRVIGAIKFSLLMKITQTDEQIIWTPVLHNWQKGRELIPEDGIPPGFQTFPIYPDFVFNKQQFEEELEILKPIYEENQRLSEEYDAKYKLAKEMDAKWDEETIKNDTFDYSSLPIPRHVGPIFERYVKKEGQRYEFVKIFVDYEGKRISLTDLLKIWEQPFVEKERAGNYGWLIAPQLYEALVVEVRERIPFHKILACFSCGDTMCWPFRIQIVETPKSVIWTNYRQPHHNKYSLGGYWDYTVYPPLVFEKKRYYEELEPLQPAYEKYKGIMDRWTAENLDGQGEPLIGASQWIAK